MTKDISLTSVDFSSISFPSDQITLGAVRQAHPEQFNREVHCGFSGVIDDKNYMLDTILYLERLLARAAFERARGTPGDYLTEVAFLERDDCVKELTTHYLTYGAAQGPQHTEQLVRDIESQAAGQAGRRR